MSANPQRAPSRTARGARLRRVASAAAALAAPWLVALAAPGAASETSAGAGASPGAPDVVEGDILSGPRRALRGIGASAMERRWVNGEVPFVIDAALTPAGANAVREAVAHWNEVSGITLIAYGANAVPPRDHLVFRSGPGCASWVGRQGGAQDVWIGPRCSAGSVMHEIGHALGLEHEHTRSDRDAHVRVNWDQIVPEKRHNFDTAPADARLLGAYDLDSIMHYGPSNFSIEGRATLEPLDSRAGARMGQRQAPSPGDIAAISRLYASDLALEVQLDDPGAATEVTLFVTNEHTQGAHDIVVTLAAEGLSVRAQSDDQWLCEAGIESVRCALPRLAANEASHVMLALGAPLDGGTLLAEVRSKTPDVELGNNGHVDGTPASIERGEPGFGAARATLADAGFAEAGVAGVPDGTASDAFADGREFDAGGGAPSMLLALCATLLFLRRGRYPRRGERAVVTRITVAERHRAGGIPLVGGSASGWAHST